jgi:hypothetical protein
MEKRPNLPVTKPNKQRKLTGMQGMKKDGRAEGPTDLSALFMGVGMQQTPFLTAFSLNP